MADTYLTYTELFCRIQAERVRLGLPPLKSSGSLAGRLHKIRRHGPRLHRLYSLEDALRVYTHMAPRHPLPWNRLGTEAEITSREYMPLATACEAFRVSHARFNSAILHLNLKAWVHPHTGKRWVHIEQAQYIAHWRSLLLLRRILTPEQLHHITTTRPEKVHYSKNGYCHRLYYCPEFSHIGSRHTAYKAPRRLAPSVKKP